MATIKAEADRKVLKRGLVDIDYASDEELNIKPKLESKYFFFTNHRAERN